MPPKEIFKDVLRSTSLRSAQDHILKNSTSQKTKTTYSSGVNLYEEMCGEKNLTPWPATVQNLLAFAGFMDLAGYASPSTYVSAVKKYNKVNFHQEVPDPESLLAEVPKAEKHSKAPPPKQDTPLSLPMLRDLFKAVESDKDLDTATTLLLSFFTGARADTTLTTQVAQLGDGEVEIVQQNLKGRGKETRSLHFFSVPKPKPAFTFYRQGENEVPCCPVGLFEFMVDRAGGNAISRFSSYQVYLRSIKVLVAKVLDLPEVERCAPPSTDWSGLLTHSGRIGATCTLLAAGVQRPVIDVLCLWESNSIDRYARQVIENPNCTEAYNFYNPQSILQAQLKDAPPQKRRKIG